MQNPSRRGPVLTWVLASALCLASASISDGASPGPGPDLLASPRGAGARLAFVPVQRFWAPRRDISLEEVRSAIEGTSVDFRRVLVASDDAAALWERLGVMPAETTEQATLAEIEAAVEGSRRVLGLLPADDVRPSLRALTVDGLSLFGGQRLADLADWPLAVEFDATDAGGSPDAGSAASDTASAADESLDFDPAATWTLAAGGDVMLDREVHRQAVLQDRGPDHPWDGGYARITSRTCCTVDGGNAITTRRAGPRGAVRSLLSSADVAIVNHEGPAPDDFSYHPSGLVFTFDPSLLQGVADAGIDIVSLANNHIRNAGSSGVLQTIRNLRDVGVRTVGAGKDPERARQPACLEQGEVRLCFLAYDAINAVVHAVTDERAGAAEFVRADVRADIRRSRRDGADVVVAVPHWGTEYTTRVTSQQRRWARAMVRAGADAVLGAHSHVIGPIEFIDGVPVIYSLGDLIFDLPRFEETEKAVIAELTFRGDRLAQLELHPTVIVDRSQVSLLDPAKDGTVVLKRMRAASRRLD